MKKVTINTTPQRKGERELDVFSSSYRVKRLWDVPISKFEDDLWLDILNSQMKGLINIEFNDKDF